MKAQQQISGTNVALIILAVVFIIWFAFGDDIKGLVEELGYGGTCKLSTLATHVSGKSEGVFPKIPPSCKTDRKSISLSELSEYEKLAKKANPNFSEKQALYWNAQRIVADAMVDCMERGWRGKLDLGYTIMERLKRGGKGAGGVVCFSCSRIRFDSSVSNLLGTEQVTMEHFLKNNFYRGIPYYDFLTEGQNDFWRTRVDYADFYFNEPFAVLFMADSSGNGGVGIYSYEDISSDLQFYLESTAYGTKKAYCGVIFGD